MNDINRKNTEKPIDDLPVEEELIVLIKDLNVTTKNRDKLNRKIQLIIQRIKDICPHDEIEHKITVISGSYLDKRQYTHKYECKLCGKLVKEEVTYGGFE